MLFLHLFHEDVFLLILAPFILEPDANYPKKIAKNRFHLHTVDFFFFFFSAYQCLRDVANNFLKGLVVMKMVITH